MTLEPLNIIFGIFVFIACPRERKNLVSLFPSTLLVSFYYLAGHFRTSHLSDPHLKRRYFVPRDNTAAQDPEGTLCILEQDPFFS